MEITNNIHSLAQQLFQLIQHQKMEITINQQTILYQDTKKTLQLRTQKKTENTVDKIIAKDMYKRYGLLIRGLPAIKLRKELTNLRVWEAMDKTTIESLSIIQRIPLKPSNTMLAEHYQWK
ncbi:hypothetical protein G9A89_014439 [Geosiphon pyriformis]|nr:hypothetical protein G9A89_014439 [Geosiphon pyriformis]